MLLIFQKEREFWEIPNFLRGASIGVIMIWLFPQLGNGITAWRYVQMDQHSFFVVFATNQHLCNKSVRITLVTDATK